MFVRVRTYGFEVIAITSLFFVNQSPLRHATRVGVDAIKELVQEGASLDLQDGVTTTSVILTSRTLCSTMEPLNEGHTIGHIDFVPCREVVPISKVCRFCSYEWKQMSKS